VVRIVYRPEWGARYGTGDGGKFKRNRIIAHTSVTPTGLGVEGEMTQVRGMESYHVKNRGFDGIGYSWLAGNSGTIYEGRGWGKNGAHTQNGGNSQGYAICFIGDGTKAPPTDAAVNAARELVAVGVDQGAVDLAYLISGHGDWYAKECPGKHVRGVMPRLTGVRGGGTILSSPSASGGQSVLGPGDFGPSIRVWQQQLNDTQGMHLIIDSDFGPATLEATKAFQRKMGLTPDGLVGGKTIEAMAAVYRRVAHTPVQPIPPVSREPRLHEQAVVTTDSNFDEPLGAALAARFGWAHIRANDPLARVKWAIVVGAAAAAMPGEEGRTILSGVGRRETSVAVLDFVGRLSLGREARRGNPELAT